MGEIPEPQNPVFLVVYCVFISAVYEMISSCYFSFPDALFSFLHLVRESYSLKIMFSSSQKIIFCLAAIDITTRENKVLMKYKPIYMVLLL